MSGEQKPQRQLAKRALQARYAVVVDGQTKSSFDTREAAEKEAQRILAGFPVLTVVVADAEMDSVKVLGPTKAKEEVEEPDDAPAS